MKRTASYICRSKIKIKEDVKRIASYSTFCNKRRRGEQTTAAGNISDDMAGKGRGGESCVQVVERDAEELVKSLEKTCRRGKGSRKEKELEKKRSLVRDHGEKRSRK